ncbi:MAG: hypothetical protein K2X35_10960 [Bryobacteraceae bacterium]|nr:hypothetical protein [Bryobacteraceae bacterium]
MTRQLLTGLTAAMLLAAWGCAPRETSKSAQDAARDAVEAADKAAVAAKEAADNARQALDAAASEKAPLTETGRTAPAGRTVRNTARPAVRGATSAVIPSGTTLVVRTTSTLSTKTAQAGETFVATLEQPLTAGGRVLAPRGSQVTGRVTGVDPGGRVKGLATLSVALVSLDLPSGGDLKLSTSTYTAQANASKKKDAAKIGIGAGVGAAIGAIAGGGKGAAIGAGSGAGAGTGVVLATRGDPAVIPAESVLRFQVR